MSTQRTLDGGEEVPTVRNRKGAIGKVERCLYIRPWLSCGEIAKCIGEPSSRVSNALNALLHEGTAQQEKGYGPRDGAVWASTAPELAERNEARLSEMKLERSERNIARGLVARPTDRRPNVMIPEDLYAI